MCELNTTKFYFFTFDGHARCIQGKISPPLPNISRCHFGGKNRERGTIKGEHVKDNEERERKKIKLMKRVK
jgi:hypothetical protein